MKKSFFAFTASLFALSLSNSAFATGYWDFQTKINEIAVLFDSGESAKACSEFSDYQSERADWVAKAGPLGWFTQRNIESVIEMELTVVDHCQGGKTQIDKAAAAAHEASIIYGWE